jgi:hypothetical protein
MGLALARKSEIVEWYPPLYTFWTTGMSFCFASRVFGITGESAIADGADALGVAASITTFSTWMEEGYLAFANFDGYQRGGLYDVSLIPLLHANSV